jgi:hypothetical protein
MILRALFENLEVEPVPSRTPEPFDGLTLKPAGSTLEVRVRLRTT